MEKPNLYIRHRYPGEVIAHAIWLYHRFTLSYRDIEELLAARGIIVSYETIRKWCRKFGPTYAKALRHRQARPGDKWHLDEVRIVINGEVHWLWRAVDQDHQTLDILVQKRRNKQAAKRFFKKLLKGQHYVPRVIITDKLRSYGAAKREILPGVEHRQHKGLNNQAELSHQPTRQQERQMRTFESAGQAVLSSYRSAAHNWHRYCQLTKHRVQKILVVLQEMCAAEKTLSRTSGRIRAKTYGYK